MSKKLKKDRQRSTTTVRKATSGARPDMNLTDRWAKNRGFDGAAAPRVGGPAKKSTSVASGTASKQAIRAAKRRVKRTAASPAAKRAARRTY